MTFPLSLKLFVPGYRAKWRWRYAAMLSELAALMPHLNYGESEGVPWIELAGGPRLHGFWTEPDNRDVCRILAPDLPPGLPVGHFRLIKDCLNRYVYPHMRPDLKPEGFPPEQMFGFHGQHKDAIADLADAEARAELVAAFTPREGEVIIDCGAFLGFGDSRLASDIGSGRIYAVEADHDCFDLLERNVQHNAIVNVTPGHRGIWKGEGELELESGFAQANSLVSEVHRGEERQRVRTVAIDTLVAEFAMPRVDMISLTLNGAEVEALEGAAETLASLRPRIRLAGWYQRSGRLIADITREQLERHGYRVFVGSRGNVMALPS